MKTTMSERIQNDAIELKRLRGIIKELVGLQVQSKIEKIKETNPENIAYLQSQIATQRDALSKYHARFNRVHFALSKLPYGLSNTGSKLKNVSTQIDIVKNEYQELVKKQKKTNKELGSKFLTVTELRYSQKNKQITTQKIKLVVKKRNKLKEKYKELSSILYSYRD